MLSSLGWVSACDRQWSAFVFVSSDEPANSSPFLATSGRATALMNVRFEGNNGQDADMTRCLLMPKANISEVWKDPLKCDGPLRAHHVL